MIVALGRQRQALHPVCAEDFAAASRPRVSTTPAAADRDFYIHGPEELTLHQALGIYRQIVAPDKRLVTIPLPVMSGDRPPVHGRQARAQPADHAAARALGERGDPTPTNQLLGAPTTTVEAWCRAQVTAPAANGA